MPQKQEQIEKLRASSPEIIKLIADQEHWDTGSAPGSAATLKYYNPGREAVIAGLRNQPPGLSQNIIKYLAELGFKEEIISVRDPESGDFVSFRSVSYQNPVRGADRATWLDMHYEAMRLVKEARNALRETLPSADGLGEILRNNLDSAQLQTLAQSGRETQLSLDFRTNENGKARSDEIVRALRKAGDGNFSVHRQLVTLYDKNDKVMVDKDGNPVTVYRVRITVLNDTGKDKWTQLVNTVAELLRTGHIPKQPEISEPMQIALQAYLDGAHANDMGNSHSIPHTRQSAPDKDRSV